MEQNIKTHGMLSNIAYTVRIAWQYDRMLFALMLAEAMTGILVPLFGAYLPKIVIDQLTAGTAVGRMTAVIGGITLALALVYCVNRYAMDGKYMRYNGMRLRYVAKLFYKTMSCDYDFMESARGQKAYQRAVNATGNGDQSGISQTIPAVIGIVTGLLSFVVFSAILSRLNPLIILLLTMTAAANYLMMKRARTYEQSRKDDLANEDRKLAYVYGQEGSPDAAKDVRLYGFKGLFGALRDKHMKSEYMLHRVIQNKHFATHLFDAVTICLRDGLAYVYLIYTVWTGRVALSDAVLYMGAITGFSAWVTQILAQYNVLSHAHLMVGDMRAFLEHQNAPDPSPAATPPPINRAPSIEFEDVSFAYEPGAYIFERFNLVIKPGETIALVGVNGVGKTTFVKLLCGLYRPCAGRVLIGGIDIAALKRDDLFALFSPVFQDYMILPLSLGENIALTHGGATDREKAARCLRTAGMEELLDNPAGLDRPMLKVWDEAGLVLSGGQTQKLLLARALYKDAPILALDEPTASLDPIAESEMYERYNAFTRGKTAVFISHRLASTRFCDRILFLKDGGVAEEGTHERLLERGGDYAAMFAIQSRYYREGYNAEEGI